MILSKKLMFSGRTTVIRSVWRLLVAAATCRSPAVQEADVIKSRQQLRQVTDHIPGLISHLDRTLKYSFVNRTYRDWHDRKPQTPPDMSARQFYGETDFSKIAPHLQSALTGIDVTTEIDMVTDEQLRHWQVQLIPERNGQGDVMCTRGGMELEC